MTQLDSNPETKAHQVRPWRVGCVSFLNSTPLIAKADDRVDLQLAVPSKLRNLLETDQVDAALLPVFDVVDSGAFKILPVGGIGCDGPTLTVRMFSRVPIESIQTVHLDGDSHTSVALLKLLMHHHGYTLTYEPLGNGCRDLDDLESSEIEAVLLIGDKVVTAEPDRQAFPYQWDLGQQWKLMTGLPFVFAVWAVKHSTESESIAQALSQSRLREPQLIEAVAREQASQHGWPEDLAIEYLTKILCYDVGEQQVQAIRRFAKLCHEAGLTQADGLTITSH